jgi:LacI family transcriptional regulator
MADRTNKGATMRDVARLAGVSTATVSFAINNNPRVSPTLRARVMAAIEQTGYAPDAAARALRRGVAPSIGLIVTDITNPSFATIALAVERAARARGYGVFICNTDEQPEEERSYLRLMRAQRVAGLLLATSGRDDAAHAAELAAEVAMPTVLIDRPMSGLAWDSVVTDNVGAAQAAVAHLVALGHRRIGYVGGLPHLVLADQRLAGYRRALADGGIPYDPRLVRQGNYRPHEAAASARALLDRPDRPTAIFGTNAVTVLGVMQGIAELGLAVPREVSVAGVDDVPWATAVRPGLTTVAQPCAELGALAVEMLLARIAQPDLPPRHVVLPTQLVVRGSAAPLA